MFQYNKKHVFFKKDILLRKKSPCGQLDNWQGQNWGSWGSWGGDPGDPGARPDNPLWGPARPDNPLWAPAR